MTTPSLIHLQAEYDRCYAAAGAALEALETSAEYGHWQDCREALRQAKAKLEPVQAEAEVQAKKDYRAQLKAEFDQAQGKRPLLDLVADPTITGTFEGWRFATVTGVRFDLQDQRRGCSMVNGCATWEDLRVRAAQNDFRGGKALRSFLAWRTADSARMEVATDRVVAWRERAEAILS